MTFVGPQQGTQWILVNNTKCKHIFSLVLQYSYTGIILNY